MMRDPCPAHGSPCELCGVRPDVACRHRPADPAYTPPRQPPEHDSRKLARDQGRNFGNRTIGGGGAYRIKAARLAGKLPEPFS